MNVSSLGFLQAASKRVMYGKSFVGIDIGTSSTKIVQLAERNGDIFLETYGEISNAPYADSEPGRVARPSPSQEAKELMDLMHEVDARSRLCGVAMPFSETLMATVDLPKRDKDQMDKIIPAEARQIIPVPIEDIMLDWYAIPEEQKDAFDTVKPKQQTEAQFQQVMIVGINKGMATNFVRVVRDSGLICEFFEIEVFSSTRACLHAKKSPTLILDLGASSTKVAIVNEHWMLVASRLIPTGSAAVTGEIMRAQNVDFLTAERLKCEGGLSPNSPVCATIEKAVASYWPYMNQIIEKHNKKFPRKVAQVLVSGAGAYMPGIIDYISQQLSLPVEFLNGFGRTRGPMILEDTMKIDGPRYAVAAGLALRGVEK